MERTSPPWRAIGGHESDPFVGLGQSIRVRRKVMLELQEKLEGLEVETVEETATTKGGMRRRVRSKEEIERERETIRKIQAGDTDAYAEIVRAYEKKVFWIAFNYVNHHEEAMDITQESFLRVFKAINRFDLRYNFYTWLYRIVVNLAIDRLRKRGKRNDVSIEEFPTDPAVEADAETVFRNREVGQKIRDVLDSMPEKYRTVILLRDVNGMSCADIGKIIECTNATTRWRLHKAREMFKEKWERIVV